MLSGLSDDPAYRTRVGIAGAALALVTGALWLRAPTVPYLAACTLATGVAAYGAPRRSGSGRRRSLALSFTLVAFCAFAVFAQRQLWQIDERWETTREEMRRRGAVGAREAIEDEGVRLLALARVAAGTTGSQSDVFAALGPMAASASERGVVLYRGSRAYAWSGVIRSPVLASSPPIDVVGTALYLTLRATAVRDSARAVAVSLLSANPPADRLARPLDALLERRFRVRNFTYVPASDTGPGEVVRIAGVPALKVNVGALDRDAVRVQTLQQIRYRNGALLAVVLVLLIAAAWRPTLTLSERAALLAAMLAAIRAAPLSEFSNATSFFDPAVYYAPLGGAFTGSVGALGLTASLVLLAILSIERERVRLPRGPAIVLFITLIVLGPFLLRDLARGISAPPWGVSLTLWSAWQGTLFLAAMVVLVGTVMIGRAIVGHSRGLSLSISGALAVVAGILGPLLWRAPSGWPGWYVGVWAAAIGTLALARRSRAFLLAATIVAGTGASTLVWGATARRRVELAARDVAGLATPDQFAVTLLERLSARLRESSAPRSRVDLLQLHAASEVAAAGFPMHLALWDARDTVRAVLAPAPFAEPWSALAELVSTARRERRVVAGQSRGLPGLQLLLAVPNADSTVTTAVVAPRSRLIPDPPFGALIGLQPPGGLAEPPYDMTLVDAFPADTTVPALGRWTRSGNELHGEWTVPGPAGPMRAQVDVNLRSLSALVQRGTLLLLGDLLLVGILWAITVAAGGGAGRWLRSRRKLWVRGYRARLTVALFAFFIVPAIAFAIWSYQRLLADDVQSRSLLVGETLRAAAASGDSTLLTDIANNFDTPILLYANGELAGASDELYGEVAPVGLFLPADVMLSLGLGHEVTAARSFLVGRDRVVFGYRHTRTRTGARLVLAAPARSREFVLENRRRDLAILVAFATAFGALAALWLSGVAARELASPIGRLRLAARALAAGERLPPLGGAPPSEFQPVFTAFRDMATDLDASRRALVEAEQRIAAVLRNVASGVIALDRNGRVILANPRAETLLDRTLPQGSTLKETIAGNLVPLIEQLFDEEPAEKEFDFQAGARQLHGRLTRLEQGGGGAVLTLDDVTELARAQRVLAWGEMARQVAHEIKNPLTPIRLGVQHLKRARSDPRVDFDRVLDTNVERILDEIDRLDEIARAFSRYGLAPDQRPPAEPTDIAAIARDTVELERLGQSSVDWRLDGAERPEMAFANGEELREVLLNLLENARLANARTVSTHLTRNGGDVVIEVVDDGEGIPADVLPRIFEPHFSTRTSGSGLGLAISRRLVEGWGGRIRVISNPRQGTRVVVALASVRPESEIP